MRGILNADRTASPWDVLPLGDTRTGEAWTLNTGQNHVGIETSTRRWTEWSLAGRPDVLRDRKNDSRF